MKKIFGILWILLGLTSGLRAQLTYSTTPDQTSGFPRKTSNYTAIMGAFADEVEVLKKEIKGRKEKKIEGLTFYTGQLEGKKVVLVQGGIGKVNAALTTTLLLEHFRPQQVLFTGIAGGLNPDYHPGDIVIATQVAHHDYGRYLNEGMQQRPTRNPYNFKENPVYFQSDSALLLVTGLVVPKVKLESIGDYKPLIHTGIVVTGDVFMASDSASLNIRRTMKADAIEMEGAAVSQICYQQKVPFLIIRSLSDNANHSASVDMHKFGPIAARNSATLVKALVQRLK
ncbi:MULTISPECIES: 5'-methylthioadenosine/adenosylhomocysteine nucleosidase [unclassified Siphonobacter]|uniref:5'-methylthioadenosine/adenosylhomocysteine nucleosidase n=1 Tax=unclassified Siphonobacter TaxID=2635712 RepID=UPI000CBCA0A8|nr:MULTISPECIES: 5'-methylthioadenosine/adenosylhomocysteine nucleosidase [unclassified Siphonobacter]MDQ1089360.1 adenosylhomocysteine nucleosidase [Siphonobacter sp. SORGH_AS_1065]MDR6195533.1 adenosylhomocysteine nucleosidase [Siphonobacter sp. SORGH_AS_0500]PKK35355.1 5'-methylthioadenosine/S-adenosylhomocysteine nucleosidase [Siphonobacter sp. SORGH_AS_0500]